MKDVRNFRLEIQLHCKVSSVELPSPSCGSVTASYGPLVFVPVLCLFSIKEKIVLMLFYIFYPHYIH